jgi:hypothetical protein
VALARELGAAAIVSATSLRRGARWVVRVEVHAGSSGRLLARAAWRDDSRSRLARKLRRWLGAGGSGGRALRRARAPAPTGEEVAEAPGQAPGESDDAEGEGESATETEDESDGEVERAEPPQPEPRPEPPRPRVASRPAPRVSRIAPPPPEPEPGRHEIYWHSGANVVTGTQRLIAGLGGGPGYSFHLTPALSLVAEVRFLVVAGNSYAVSAGGEYGLARGFWQPSLGLFGRAFFGGAIEVIDSEEPQSPPGNAGSLDVAVNALRFARGPYTASVLGFSLGIGLEDVTVGIRGRPTLGLSLTFLSVGRRL